MACYGCPGRWKGLPGAADQLQRADELLLGEQLVGLYRPKLSEMRSRILDALSANPRFRADTRSIRVDGADWLLASPADPAELAPALPR